uniref:Uncharacterized protein n=1 Tax=Pseudomonas fluorescens (strain SBW25) TaxID=216595 RepID=A0A0G4E5S1_PSEFS|nr:hypothetical protein [Pseudomonas fluorescens]CEK42317.1 hypothetical protein PQBR57_0364 [Pseudomonas fluorescens SBW25]
MYLPRPSLAEDAYFAEKVTQALAHLQQPYDSIQSLATCVLEAGIPKLKLVVEQPALVLRLADALHRIPRAMCERNLDALRTHVAEATVAMDEL